MRLKGIRDCIVAGLTTTCAISSCDQ